MGRLKTVQSEKIKLVQEVLTTYSPAALHSLRDEEPHLLADAFRAVRNLAQLL